MGHLNITKHEKVITAGINICWLQFHLCRIRTRRVPHEIGVPYFELKIIQKELFSLLCVLQLIFRNQSCTTSNAIVAVFCKDETRKTSLLQTLANRSDSLINFINCAQISSHAKVSESFIAQLGEYCNMDNCPW